MAHRKIYDILLLWPLALIFVISSPGQAPFTRTGQVFLSGQSPGELMQLTLSSGGSPQIVGFASSPPGGIDALGFRKTDNLLYGICLSNNHLYRAGADGIFQDLGAPALNNTLIYLAGDVSPDGQYLYSIGSSPGGNDLQLARTDLTDPSFTTTTVPMSGITNMADIAFDPFTNILYGFDRVSRQMLTINTLNGSVSPLGQLEAENEIKGLYFNAFGELYGYGSSLFGIVDALFLVNKNTGKEKRLATGSLYQVRDAASCPFSVVLRNDAEPEKTLPCTELTFTYTLANGSGETLTGLQFEHALPPGFHLASVSQNTLGVPVDTLSQPGAVLLDNFTLPPGRKQLTFEITVNDIPAGPYKSQALLKNLPALYGLVSRSDDPGTGGFEDSTTVKIHRIEADSLSYFWFVCQGSSILLDASDFGDNVVWNTGATGPQLEVAQGGIYSVKVETGCQTFQVTHDVTTASCPFTISMAHVMIPDTIFACSDLTFRYIFDNNSGEERRNVSFLDTLPQGFTFLNIAESPEGAVLKSGLPPDVVCLENLTLPEGKDTLDLLVHAGDVLPGQYLNQALIYNLPQVLGPSRLSDYPFSLPLDASPLHVLGTLSDTSYFDTVVCANAELRLDASQLGRDFIWQDGSTGAEFLVKEPGEYRLTLFDGCGLSEVFWEVGMGTPIEISMLSSDSIHQGESLSLRPSILNEGSNLSLSWTDPLGNSLSCRDCLSPVATPLQPVTYSLVAANETCSDTASILLLVNTLRRIYAPTAFSPNFDGINDYFFLQSPDFGIIRDLLVMDRWGAGVFNSKVSVLNEEKSGWDGTVNGQVATPGTYTWKADIEFIDGKRSLYYGTISILY